jgi:hypothetical protein
MTGRANPDRSTAMKLPQAHEKIVEAWINKNWKVCPFCAKANPGWQIERECELAFSRQPQMGASKAMALLPVIPIVCKHCFATSFLARTQFPGLP